MFERIRRNWLVFGCVAVLLLAVVAGVFQFRWINFASDSHRRQQREVTAGALRNFRGDFRDALLQPLPFFRPPPDANYDFAVEPYLIANARRWRSNSDRPQLIASISCGTQSKQGILFHRLQLGAAEFKTEDWPQEYSGYRRALEEGSGSSGNPSPLVPNEAKFAFLQGRPVLIFPLLTGPSAALITQGLRGWCFLEFDQAYLRDQLVPEIVARHYRVGGQNQVAIIVRHPPNVIYSSEPTSTAESLARVDAGIVLIDESELPVAPPPGSSNSAPEPQPKLAGSGGIPLDEIGGERAGSDGQAWLLVVKNKSGSVDALVENVRLHLIMFSIIVLALLAGASVMLMLATLRARRLAGQQMEFVAGVSHELRTPLTVIQSTSYNLSQGTIKDPGRVQQYGDVIGREARRLIDQIERMLSFAGIQSGRRVYDLKPTDVREVTERALDEFAVHFAEGDWQIERDFADDLPPVFTNGPALEGALKNLFENALKYAAEGKWLSVSVSATTGAKGAEVRIVVADHGPGIAPADLRHIFEPFYRGRGASSGTTSGAGLGLCLVDRTMRALGGRVTVKSTSGEGTRFTVHLPVS